MQIVECKALISIRCFCKLIGLSQRGAIVVSMQVRSVGLVFLIAGFLLCRLSDLLVLTTRPVSEVHSMTRE